MRRITNRIATLSNVLILAGGGLWAQTVTISPGYVNLPLGGTQQFKAAVTGLTPTTVTWGVTAGGGTITPAGLYTAPETLPENSVLISATSTANPKISAVVYVNPEPPGPTITAMSPNPLPVGNDTITITASASAPFVRGATMTCADASLTTKFISATAISAVTYVGASQTTVACHVNNPGTWQSNSLAAPVKGSAPSTPAPVVSPATATVALSGKQQFSASNVTSWSAGAGSITVSGLYTAPATTTATGTDTVTATGPGGSGTAKITLATPLVVSPATATVVLGGTQQFSAANATGWSAASGTITSAGLYTAPALMPASGKDTVTATSANGNGAATVTLTYPAPAILSLTPATLPLGSFTATIAGTGFVAQSTASLGGTPLIVTAQTATSLAVSGFASTTGMVNLVVSNGATASAPLAVQVGNPNALVSAAAARRFLEQAAFGPSPADAANVQTLGFQGWLSQQFAMRQISNYNAQLGSSQGGLPTQFLANAVSNPDQLRQKVAFALSQIFVTSFSTIIWDGSMIPYEQMLMADAFTNYRQIMGDVTLSATMGQYLDMANNAMGNPATGTIANQNYAREVMQLFTIGTTMLNQDGTPQLDGNGLPVPTYLQPAIADTSRVFTGFTYLPASGPVEWNDYINPAGPMVPYPSEHDMGSKQLLNGYPEPSGLSPQQDVSNALDNIFNHPNVGPFVGKILIQHLVKSNPSPAYVARVAAAFANNGNGVRGDMQAVITAILLDPEARANDNGGNDQPTDGHLQEPALFIAGMVRAFGGVMSNQNYFGWDLVNMSQDIYNPPSVFNYYTPSFVPPGSTLLGPEFQIYTPDAAVYRANMVGGLFFSWSNPVLNYGPGTNLDITPYVALAANPATLVAALDLTLTHGTMPAAMKQAIVTAVTNDTNGNLSRVETGAWLILTSNYYNVWH
ncbi:MAG: DUF1800 family protein [Bryobacteraceae bacterium]|jgi:uncharacterized protein (DUF1800 family)